MKKTDVRENKKCYVCGFQSLSPIFTLGELYFSDFIEGGILSKYKKFPLELVLCDKKAGGCGLLQLKHVVSNELMYRNYWYRSGVNQTMTNELQGIVRSAESLVQLKSEDCVLDIGSNDGTLLKSYRHSGIQRIGFEPARNLMKYARQKGIKIINNFFNFADWKHLLGNKKAKVITAIAMFYDLEDPNTFVSDIVKCLDKNGVFIIQMAYLPSMLSQNAFDNICHEHLQYYSLLSLEHLLGRHNLEVFDVLLNDINGGSFRIYIRHKGSRQNTKISSGAGARVKRLRSFEKKLGLDGIKIYNDFARRVLRQRERLLDFIRKETARGKSTYVYGASTKGNTLLQFYNLDNRFILAAAERNPDKWGKKTIGTSIPIMSEEEARSHQPDYFLILPWHFLKEFKQRETKFFQRGGKFIVPLPRFKIIGKRR